MTKLEKKIEDIAADLIMADLDDMPALAKIHEGFLQAGKLSKSKKSVFPKAAQACADLVEKIILNDVPDKKKSWQVVTDSLTAIQSLVRDKRKESEVHFPEELDLGTAKAKAGKKQDGSPAEQVEQMEEKSSGDPDTVPQDDVEKNEQPAESQQDEPEESYIINLEQADSDLVADFINEAREHCNNAEQMLMDLETGDDKDGSINAIFRSFHTIKGAAGFLDLRPIMHLAHESETLLDLGRKGSLNIEGKIADIVFDAIDALRKLLDGAETALSEGTTFDAREIVPSLLQALRSIISNPDELPPEGGDRVGDRLIDAGLVTQNQIDSALSKRTDPTEKLGETLVKQNVLPAKAVARALRQQKKARQEKTAAVKEMVKIDTERLDRMVDTIGELVIAESMVGQDEEILSKASHKVVRNISHLNKITRELQEMGMAMRLVPVKGTFQKLARAVRDLTRKSGKTVELQTQGEDTEVDRSIIELIGDPLMHMIRNSIDHGIEMPAERVESGKPEMGTVKLMAYHKGGKVYFDIKDDGRGLDKDKILAKAVEKNLIEPGKDLTDSEIYQLILLPGFSTAARITDISGRGVGMDVVKRNIEAMRGHLEIDSKPGEGTTFSMKLPLTLAIIEGMLVSIAQELYIIPTLSVVESLSLTQDMISTITGRDELVDLRGEMLPLIRISRLFNLRPVDEEETESTVVVVEDGLRKIGLVVDKLLGQRQTVIKSLGTTFARQKWISGGAILSDGNVGLIIDIGGVMELAHELRHELYSRNNSANAADRRETTEIKKIDESVVYEGEDVSEVAGTSEPEERQMVETSIHQ